MKTNREGNPAMERTALVLLILAVAAGPASAQSTAVSRLERPTAAFPEPFSQISGLRELSDGRLVVADMLEKSVSLVNLRTGELVPVGREGQGPGEYLVPGALYALPADTTLLLDVGNLRGLIITPEGRVGQTIPFQQGEATALFFPRAADGRGRLYSQSPMMFRDGAVTQPDSTPILRLDRGGAPDTVAWIPSPRLGGGGAIAFRGPGGGAVNLRGQPYQPQDAWAVASDGSIALVHPVPYRVEWVRTGGRRSAGPVLPYEPVRIGAAEKEEWANRPGPVMTMRTPEGSRTIRPPRPDVGDLDWPETKPPFEAGAVSVTPEGELWIRVSRPAASKAPLYDVVDGQGRLARRVQLPEGRRLVGFGRGVLYAAYQDADDLQWLERYAR